MTIQNQNSALLPNPFGAYPNRKITPMYNYADRRWQFAIAKKTAGKVTIYLDVNGGTFSSLDTDSTHHSLDVENTLTEDDLTTLLAIAIEDPKEAIALFSELPEHLKPELRESLKDLPVEAKAALKSAAKPVEAIAQ